MKNEHMNIDVNVKWNNGMQWSTFAANSVEVWTKGFAFNNGRLYKETQLASLFAETFKNSPENERERILVALLRVLNGNFAVLLRSGRWFFAAVDRMRSIPLFFGETGTHLLFSDDARFIYTQQSGEKGFDRIAQSEFLLTGYVVGNKTLSPAIRQLGAGQYIILRNGELEENFYYKHLHSHDLFQTEHEYFADLVRISDSMFRRLIESASDRTIVIPLSGGYDSRYIAAMLRKFNYGRVICFSYGRPTSFEVITSRKVAQALNYDWHFIEYDRRKWAGFLGAKEFQLFAANMASLPHLQEYIAVQELSDRALIPRDSVFVPGYCGDLLGGSYVPRAIEYGKEKDLLKMGIVEYIYRTHFNLKNTVPKDNETFIKNHIQDELRQYPAADDLAAFISLNEAFFTCHKVAKFVVNALRVYEHFGYSWRMPLWDNELMDYWYSIPLKERTGDKLYNRFLLQNIFLQTGVSFPKAKGLADLRSVVITKSMISTRLFNALKRLYEMRPLQKRFQDFNAFSYLSLACRDELTKKQININLSENVNQVYAVWFLDFIQAYSTGRE